MPEWFTQSQCGQQQVKGGTAYSMLQLCCVMLARCNSARSPVCSGCRPPVNKQTPGMCVWVGVGTRSVGKVVGSGYTAAQWGRAGWGGEAS